MHESLKVGRPVPVEELPTLADSLGGGIGLRNRHTFAMARALVDQVILVDEAEIAGAIRHAYAEERQIVEGGAAVGIAALLREGKVEWGPRSEEHTSELQSLMRISYAVFCLKKKKAQART